jgi:hypothetical protein
LVHEYLHISNFVCAVENLPGQQQWRRSELSIGVLKIQLMQVAQRLVRFAIESLPGTQDDNTTRLHRQGDNARSRNFAPHRAGHPRGDFAGSAEQIRHARASQICHVQAAHHIRILVKQAPKGRTLSLHCGRGHIGIF